MKAPVISKPAALLVVEQVSDIDTMNQKCQAITQLYKPPLKKAHLIASVALGIITAYVFKQARPMWAAGMGLLALAVLVTGYRRNKEMTPEHQEIADLFSTATSRLHCAWGIKSNVLCRHFNDPNLHLAPSQCDAYSAAYDDNTSTLITKIDDIQAKWRNIHRDMLNAAKDIADWDMEHFKNDQRYCDLFKKYFVPFQEASVRFVYGQSPKVGSCSYIRFTHLAFHSSYHATAWGE